MAKQTTNGSLSAREKDRRTVRSKITNLETKRAVIKRATSRVRLKTQIGNDFRG